MEGVIANFYFALCFLFFTSSPTVNAIPMTPFYRTAFFQQNYAISSITEAITVSHIAIYIFDLIYAYLHVNNSMQQDAVVKAVADAQQNFKTDLTSALTDLLHDQINSFNPYGEIDFDDSHIEFEVHPSSTVGLFQLLPFSSPAPLPSISVEQMVYTIDTSELFVCTHSYGSQTIIPDILSLQNVALSFSVSLQDVSTLVVTFTGEFVLGGLTIPVEVVYTHASRNTNINAKVSELSINTGSSRKTRW